MPDLSKQVIPTLQTSGARIQSMGTTEELDENVTPNLLGRETLGQKRVVLPGFYFVHSFNAIILAMHFGISLLPSNPASLEILSHDTAFCTHILMPTQAFIVPSAGIRVSLTMPSYL